jgi:hypothetical protein
LTKRHEEGVTSDGCSALEDFDDRMSLQERAGQGTGSPCVNRWGGGTNQSPLPCRALVQRRVSGQVPAAKCSATAKKEAYVTETANFVFYSGTQRQLLIEIHLFFSYTNR